MSGGRFRRLGALAVVFAFATAGCSKRADEPEDTGSSRRTTTTTSVGEAPAPPGDDPVVTTTVAGDLFAAVTTEAPPPAVALEVRLSGAVSGVAAGSVTARCLRGDRYLDVEAVADPPLVAGRYGITSLVFSAPGFRGPGRYEAAAAADEEWAVSLVDLETGEPLEFYAPMSGVGGSVTVDPGGTAGAFDIRGLIDDEERAVTVTGRFTCGTVEE